MRRIIIIKAEAHVKTAVYNNAHGCEESNGCNCNRT